MKTLGSLLQNSRTGQFNANLPKKEILELGWKKGDPLIHVVDGDRLVTSLAKVVKVSEPEPEPVKDDPEPSGNDGGGDDAESK